MHSPPKDLLTVRLPRGPLLLMVYIAAMGSAYWVNFIWFYLDARWQTKPATNLLINSGFGLFYFVGCLATARATRRFAARHMLIAGFSVLIVLTLFSAKSATASAIAKIICLHAFVVSWTWPNLEMLLTAGHHGKSLGRAIGRYNIAWALTSAVSLAVAGKFYEWDNRTLFAIPIAAWVIGIFMSRRFIPIFGHPNEVHPVDEGEPPADTSHEARGLADLMKTLSRSGNMASYIMLSTLIPTLPAVTKNLGLELGEATAFGSIWAFSRVASFFLMGRWHGWHFRPFVFMGAMVSLPILFSLILISPSLLVVGLSQVLLGLAVGLVYASSLFYSLHGAAPTSEAAYHEAVIGMGMMAGPLLAAFGGYLGGQWGYRQTHTISIAVSLILLIAVVLMARRWRADTREMTARRDRLTA